MPDVTLALVLGAIAVLVVDVGLFGILIVPAVSRRTRTSAAGGPDGDLPLIVDGEGATDGVPAATYNRVVRFASWAYILFTALFVGLTGLWPHHQPAIYAVLAIAGALVFLVHDILPAERLGRAKYVLESLIAVGLVTAVVVLTEGLKSPFFFAYPLVVAGAALVATPPVTFGLAGLATAAYLVAATQGVSGSVDTTTVAVAGINVAALVLLTYIAYVIAREQRRTRAAAIRLSTTDGLTALANRSYLMLALEREIDRGIRYERGFCLLMADLDGLKGINDTYGHSVGDRVLIHVAQVIREGIRRIDIPSRLSGDEFVVLLPETDPTGAYVVAEKIRQGVAELDLHENGERINVSVSIGVVAWPDAGSTIEMLMAAVDAAMYASKRRGKNRIAGPGGPSLRRDDPRRDDPPRPRALPDPVERTLLGGPDRHAIVVPIRGMDAPPIPRPSPRGAGGSVASTGSTGMAGTAGHAGPTGSAGSRGAAESAVAVSASSGSA